MNEDWARVLVRQNPAEAYRMLQEATHFFPWTWQVAIAKQTSKVKEAITHPLADQLEAQGLDANVADTSLLRNRDEAQRLSKGKFTAAELKTMQGIATAGDDLGRKKSVAEQKKQTIDEQTARLGDLMRTPAYVLAGPSHSMIAKDHSNSPFFGLAFKCGRTALAKIVDKVIDAWVEAHGEEARKPSPPAAVNDANKNVREDKEALARLRQNEWTESNEFGEKVLEHGGDPKQSYDLAGQREASAKNLENTAAVLHALAGSPDKLDAALKTLSGGLGKLNPLWAQKLARSLTGAGTIIKREGGGAAEAAELQKLAADLDADAKMIRQALTGPAREAANDKLAADRARAFNAMVTRPQVAPATRILILALLDQEIDHTAVAYRTRQVEALAAAPAPKVEHIEMPALKPERKTTPALVALLATTREVFSHPYEGVWWRPAVLEYIQKHRDILLASIEARNARYVVFPGGKH